MEISALEAISSSIYDTPVLLDFLNLAPPDEKIGSVTADDAHDMRNCHHAIVARNAHAVILLHTNAKLGKPVTPGTKVRSEAVRSSKYLR